MRRDVFVENDSGGLSVISGAAIERVIADGRTDDERFVRENEALLLMLYGDDSMPVRVVADEPLGEEESRQWLACVRWKLNVPDGRVVIAGGFDPDVLSGWLEKEGPNESGWGVKVIEVPAGTWFVDLYAHVGSMNGRELIDRHSRKVGAWFREDHAEEPLPLWLVRRLSHSGEDDPGRSAIWSSPEEAFRKGTLKVDTEHRGYVGFVLHLQRQSDDERSELPPGGWFDLDTGARMLDQMPKGIPSEVEDPELVGLAHDLTGASEEDTSQPDSALGGSSVVSVIDDWEGADLDPVAAGGAAVELQMLIAPYLIAKLALEGTPSFEAKITSAPGWDVPPTQHDVAFEARDGEVRAGPPEQMNGWPMLSAMVMTGQHLSSLPDGTTLEVAMAPDIDQCDDDDPSIGRLRLRGTVRGGTFYIAEASPRVSGDTLRAALAFTHQLFINERIEVHGPEERATVEASIEEWRALAKAPGPSWKGDICELKGCDERLCCLIGAPLFRQRFGGTWPMSAPA
jgi:hypothetical protein